MRTGEYRRTATISVTDLVPNGVCPLSATINFATGASADCAPAPAFAPTGATIASGTQHADGTFDLAFVPIATLAQNSSLVITYAGRMRTTYTGNGGGVVTGSPTVSGDSFTNTVSLARSGGHVTVHDTSSATGVGVGVVRRGAVRAAAAVLAGTTGHGLPRTGADVGRLIGLGVLLMLLGIAALRAGRESAGTAG